MLIGQKMTDGFNQQIGNEFGASMQYLHIAAYFEAEHLQLLADLFYEQAEEEKEHAMKFVHYVVEAGGDLRIPAVPAAGYKFSSAEDAVEAALKWEMEVTQQVNDLMRLALDEGDFLAQNFLRWFVDEQLEEVTKMDQLLSVVRRSGEKNLLMVEAYLAHIQKK
jgi:bacterioferritin B